MAPYSGHKQLVGENKIISAPLVSIQYHLSRALLFVWYVVVWSTNTDSPFQLRYCAFDQTQIIRKEQS